MLISHSTSRQKEYGLPRQLIKKRPCVKHSLVELLVGIEPTTDDYKSTVLPLNYKSRFGRRYQHRPLCCLSNRHYAKIKMKGDAAYKCVVESAGVEPTPTGSKPVVLPLHKPSMSARLSEPPTVFPICHRIEVLNERGILLNPALTI